MIRILFLFLFSLIADVIRANPKASIVASASGPALYFMEITSPYIAFTALILSLILGVMQYRIKRIELKKLTDHHEGPKPPSGGF